VVPGIMPIVSRRGMERMSELAAGARFPAPLLRALSRTRNDDGVQRVGTHWATAQVAELLNADVPGVHLYTLNNSGATMQICRNLGLDSYRIAR
jgi:methylenetetrahydrofolate reductase (NADPH)